MINNNNDYYIMVILYFENLRIDYNSRKNFSNTYPL